MAEKKKLKWIVYRHDFNANKIVTFNIFDHWKFEEDVIKDLKKYKDKDDFTEQLRRNLQYWFWSKSEHEVVITSFPPYITMNELDNLNEERLSHKEKYLRDPFRLRVSLDTGAKIDIYSQVMNNFEIFCDYVWNSKHRKDAKDKIGD